jgi:hypothetical protein
MRYSLIFSISKYKRPGSIVTLRFADLIDVLRNKSQQLTESK